MTPSRPRRGNWLLAACLASILGLASASSAPAAGFSTTLPADQRSAVGLDRLTESELETLDGLVASDLATARQLRTTTFAGRFSDRHAGQQTGLERLDAAQLARVDELIADAIAAQSVPRERPRLPDNEVVSLKRRLEVHGGMSFTVGWASGGRDFREAGAWVSYFDTATGLGLSFAFSQYSGDAIYPYGCYPYYPSSFDGSGWYGGAPGDSYTVGLSWTRPKFALGLSFTHSDFDRPNAPWFDGTGASLRLPARPKRL
jgi:hypothetical protein